MLWSLSSLSFISVHGSLTQQHFNRLVKRNAILCGTFLGMFWSGSENFEITGKCPTQISKSHSPPSTWDVYCKWTKRKYPIWKCGIGA